MWTRKICFKLKISGWGLGSSVWIRIKMKIKKPDNGKFGDDRCKTG